ncbi:hypothetical protein ElyMa_006064100 [Elysia marginata]|uniref:Uncharacterized protein n=1 Tax=Elysia marginata TaxID=1093978 RepID=A0AAV4GNH4_9GAST|nr:hypothetical protein ElyMa_006064100 [Elysia marginata]
MSPSRSASDIPCSQAPPTMWSQRTLPGSDIIIKGEGMFLDFSQNKSTPRAPPTISSNVRVVGGASVTSSASITRSYLQTKIGAKAKQDNKDETRLPLPPPPEVSEVLGNSQGTDEISSRDGSVTGSLQHRKQPPPGSSNWTWDSGRDNLLLDPWVDTADQTLFQQCREHLDAINQSTQLQQVVNDEMRSQAEVNKKNNNLIEAFASHIVDHAFPCQDSRHTQKSVEELLSFNG